MLRLLAAILHSQLISLSESCSVIVRMHACMSFVCVQQIQAWQTHGLVASKRSKLSLQAYPAAGSSKGTQNGNKGMLFEPPSTAYQARSLAKELEALQTATNTSDPSLRVSTPSTKYKPVKYGACVCRE